MAVTRSQRVRGGLWGSGQSVHPLQQIAIQPTPVPSNPHLQAPRYEAGGNLTRLAQSLRGFNQSLNNLANTNAAINADPNSRDNRDWIAKRQQMSLDELREEARNNTPNGIRVREDALNMLLAETAASQLKLDFYKFYNTEFDKTSGNIQQAFGEFQQRYSETLPSDIARGLFFQRTKGFEQEMFATDQNQKIEHTLQQLGTSLTDSFRNTIEDAILQGKTPEEAAALVFTNGAAMADFMSLSPQSRDKSLFALAQEYALQGNEAMVRALLESDRGALGPALVKQQDYITQSLALINQAGDNFRKKKQEKDLPTLLDFNRMRDAGELTKDNAQIFVDQHGLNPALVANAVSHSEKVAAAKLEAQEKYEHDQTALDIHNNAQNAVLSHNLSLLTHAGSAGLIQPQEIPNPQGTGTITLSVEQQLQDATDEMESGWAATATKMLEQGMSEADVQATLFVERMVWYGTHNIKHEGWAATLNSIATAAPLEMLLKDEATLQYAKGAAQLMQNIKAKNPVYFESLMQDKASRQFWQAYELAKQREGLSDEAALRQAARMIAEPLSDKIKRMPDKQQHETILVQIKQGLKDYDGSVPANEMIIQEHVNDLIAAGASPDSLASHALRQIKGSYFMHHGVLTRFNADAPQDVISLLDTIINTRFDEFKDRYGLPSADDLYFKPDPTGTSWTLHSKQYLGVEIGSPITLSDLTTVREESGKKQQERIKPAIERLQRNTKINAKEAATVRKAAGKGVVRSKPEAAQIKAARDKEREKSQTRLDHYQNQLERIQQPVPYARNPKQVKKVHGFLERAIMGEKMTQARLDVEELLEQGLTPKSKQWQDWQKNHGLDIATAVEQQLFGRTSLSDNQAYKP